MKKESRWEKMTSKEMFEHSSSIDTQVSETKPSDFGVRVGLLLLLPYVMWLSKYSAAYVASVQGKSIHLNFDGIMQSFHSLISNANMLVHESGHGVCYIFHCPQFITALNGTLFQLALPLIFIFYYYRRENMLLSGLGGIWLAQNLIYVSWYMSYAQTPNLYPFFLGGKDTIHDFWYIFSNLGVLEYDGIISGFVRVVAVLLLFGSYGYLLYLSFMKNTRMAKKRGKRERK